MKKRTKSAATQKSSSHAIPVAILIGSFAIAVSIIVYGIITAISSQLNNPTNPKQVYENISFVRINKSPILGNKNAPVTIVEYTDFDCPICKATYDQIIRNIKKDYIATGKVKLIFKSLPLAYLHPNAFRKTEAAYCARELGGDSAFFTYYDSLFTNFGFSLNLDNELVTIAEKNGLNKEKFSTCLQSDKYKDAINQEVTEGTIIGSVGTPTWLIGKSNGDGIQDAVRFSGLIDYRSFQGIVNQILEN